MMRHEGKRVYVTLNMEDADRLCRLPREFLGFHTVPDFQADTCTFTFSPEGFANLLLALGSVAGEASKHDTNEMWKWIALANKVNEGNPNFTPYEVPDSAAASARTRDPKAS